MEVVDKKYFVYSMDKNRCEILESFYYDYEDDALDMAYRLKKYSQNVFIRKECTYEYEE